MGEWSDWSKPEGCSGEICRTREITTKPAYGGEACPALKECKKFDNTFTPQASVSCVLDRRGQGSDDDEYDCKATSSVGAKFDWNPDYDPISANHGDSCKDSDTESYKKYIIVHHGPDWKLDKVYVTVDPCNVCGKNVTVMFDVQ